MKRGSAAGSGRDARRKARDRRTAPNLPRFDVHPRTRGRRSSLTTNTPVAALPSPYLMEEPPTSHGRVLLAKAFEHYCTLEWGLIGPDIACAFDGTGGSMDQARVRMTARTVGQVLARGAVRAWARPIGGGEPVLLRASTWELDDFTRRFASSALDPTRPFDAATAPTHWIFVDLDDWNALLVALVGEPSATRPRARLATPPPQEAVVEASPRPAADEDRLVRLPELKRRTGLSRSSIYRRMEDGRFPSTVPMSGNVAAWRESEVAEWLSNPR